MIISLLIYNQFRLGAALPGESQQHVSTVVLSTTGNATRLNFPALRSKKSREIGFVDKIKVRTSRTKQTKRKRRTADINSKDNFRKYFI